MDHRKLAASLAASLFVASSAMAAQSAQAPSSIVSDFATWAGGRQNADALVHGLHNGSSITLATNGRACHNISLAGFTPGAPMSFEEVREALASARSSLAHLGLHHPTAEQIQAALIGGEVELAPGRTRVLPGTVAVLGGNPNVASR